jgi:hypothetical protein
MKWPRASISQAWQKYKAGSNAVLKTASSRQACMRSGGKPSRGASIDGDVDDIRHHNASRFEER